MTRSRWMYLAIGLVAVLVAGLLVWRPWTAGADPCSAAVTSTGRPPAATSLAELASPGEREIVTSVQPPFGQQRAAVPRSGHPRPGVGGTVILESADGAVGAVDARTGERVWAFEQNGTVFGAAKAGGGMVLLQQADGSPATAISIGIEDGQVRGCTTFPEGEPAATGATVVAVAERTVALLRRDDTGGATLSLVDPARAEPVWTREVDLPDNVEYASAAGDTIVFGAAGTDPTSAWQLAVDERGTVTPEDLRLYAFSATDGAPLWDYAHEDFASQVVGMAFGTVVVRASRFDEHGGRFANRLIALDARTGEELWSAEQPASSATYYEQSTVFGDVVVSSESDPQRGTFVHLAARDLTTGEELWRIPNRITKLERAGLVGDLAMIPGKTGRGMELVNVRTGESRTAFDGLSVNSTSADGTSIGVEFHLSGEQVLVTYERLG
ncbi:outer membrane protein assembly factor BamB family protein [Prauserella flavalba]|uniref:outer membrane protein assembly factor BamB family protein n=1 Tax=Prauserella flavalba TaxID=1477506 RepID=UPI0036EF04DE